jgi:hypothetical protein
VEVGFALDRKPTGSRTAGAVRLPNSTPPSTSDDYGVLVDGAGVASPNANRGRRRGAVLASDENRYVTGSELMVDGGVSG